jgi:bifunctional non-homologous end joining protein LigD
MSPRRHVEITYADRVMFPDGNITKGDVVEHYRRVADVMFPHLKDRPLTLQRLPRGIAAKGFIQQDVSNSAPPDWLDRAVVERGDGARVEHAVANRSEGLVWLANQNVVTPHAWLSRTARLGCPDLMIIDLDPSGTDFGAVRDTAYVTRDLLADLGLTAHAQLTGSRGVHVVTALSGSADFDTVRSFARDLAEVLVADDPNTAPLRPARHLVVAGSILTFCATATPRPRSRPTLCGLCRVHLLRHRSSGTS